MITSTNIKKFIRFRAESPQGKMVFKKVLDLFFSPEMPVDISYEISCREIDNFESNDLYEWYKITGKLSEKFNWKLTTFQIMDAIIVNCHINTLIKHGYNIKLTIPPPDPNMLN